MQTPPTTRLYLQDSHCFESDARIDFKLEGFSAAMCAELERKVNAVLEGDHAVTSCDLPEAEFRTREDLLRTLEAKTPVSHGRMRVVEIQGFDAQACGSTHVSATYDVGRFSIFRTDNRGNLKFFPHDRACR